jgi:DNA-binding beta-propeller fold protein YncE
MSAAPTRRGFLAGALATAAGPTLGRAEAAAPKTAPMRAKQRVSRRGRALAVSPDGRRIVVAHDRRRTIAIHSRGATRLVDVGGQPVEVAISPDGAIAAVTTAFWDKPGLAIVDLHAAAVRTRVEVGPAPFGVVFTPSGRRVVVSGGEQEGSVHIVETKHFSVAAHAPIGTVPRGLVTAGEEDAWVVLNGLDRIVRVDLATGHYDRKIRTLRLPDRIAMSPDGRRLLVTHGGSDAEHVSEIDIRSKHTVRHRAGRLPSGVAWTRAGKRLVTLGGDGSVVVLGGGRRRRIEVGGAPRGLAVAGRHAWTVDNLTGAVAKVRT